MKTVKEKAEEYLTCNFDSNDIDLSDAFKEGVEFAQSWIPVGDELPKLEEDGFSKNVLICDDPQNEDDARICYTKRNLMNGEIIWAHYEHPAYWRPITLK